jgi:hypothetical protein
VLLDRAPSLVDAEVVEDVQGFGERPVLVLERHPDTVVVAADDIEPAVTGGVGEEAGVLVGKPATRLLVVAERPEHRFISEWCELSFLVLE